MSTDQGSLYAKISTCYSQLTAVANQLNSVSDELGQYIIRIENVLKQLNLGITAWVQLRSKIPDEGAGDLWGWWEDVGYAKTNGPWGIALRRTEAMLGDPPEKIELQPFNEAPRTLRLLALDKIPELIEALSKQAFETTKQIQSKLEDVQTVVRALEPAAPPNPRLKLKPAAGTMRPPESSISPPGPKLRPAAMEPPSQPPRATGNSLPDVISGPWSPGGKK